jgi:NADH dehydrogenase
MTSVVIVGSGFTGFECARHLSRKLRKNHSSVDISIISPVDYMLYTPLLPDVAGGLVDARFVAIPLANTLRDVQLIRGRVDGVDFDSRTVTFTDPEERVRNLSWDRLVLTPGSVTRLFDVPGLAEHARGLKSTAEALYLRDHVLEQLELADVDDDPGRAAARRTIVVVGASYSGTELAVQLRALADSAAKQMNFDPADVKFVLLDLADQVMPEVGEKLGAAAQRVLKARGIDVRLGITLKEVHAEHVVLSDDSLIRTHTVAWVTGVTGAPLIEKLGLPTEKGRLKVQTDLQVPSHPDVFSAGDAAAAEELQTPQHGTGRRPRPPLRRRQPAQHPTVRVPRQGRHACLPPLRDPAIRQSVGGVAGLPHRRVLRPFRGVDRPVVRGGCAVPRQRGHPDAQARLIETRAGGNATRMATYRVLNPKGEVVDTKDIESADDAHAWFVDQKADPELGWRMEVKADDGHWAFFDDSEGDRKY